MEIIEDKTFDAERALYGSRGVTVRRCRFDGPADGESAFKESADIVAEDCFFNLRYPFWHDRNVAVRRSDMTENCRAVVFGRHHDRGHENARHKGAARVP